MKFVSTNGRAPAVGFREAVMSGLAPDGGLYIPADMPKLSESFLSSLSSKDLHAIGTEVAAHFIDDVTKDEIASIVRDAWNFPVPLIPFDGNISLLELFHGPTLAFKDVGARFLARTMSYYLRKQNEEITIAVATSGDTGSAVAHGFFGVPNITVLVLYPSGRVSRLQEQQMTTLGGNIRALEVLGTFDDCQSLVKQALADPEVVSKRNLTTANSISLGRLVPQIVYYMWAVAQLRQQGTMEPPTIVVPSGNFGNLTAALYARAMGLSVAGYIAATNANDVVPEYLRSGEFTPRPSVATCSNAMDVGNPSNLARIQALFGHRIDAIRRVVSTEMVSDEETVAEIRNSYERTGVIIDPHTAVGTAAARRRKAEGPVVVAATAHPGKFPDVIRRAIGIDNEIPPRLAEALNKPKQSTRIRANFEELKSRLL